MRGQLNIDYSLDKASILAITGGVVGLYYQPYDLKEELYVINSSGMPEKLILSSEVIGGTFPYEEYITSSSVFITSNPHNTWQTVLNVNTNILPIGNYIIRLNYMYNSDSTTSNFMSRFSIDGVFQGINDIIHAVEPKHAAINGALEVPNTGSSQRLNFSYPFEYSINTQRAIPLIIEIQNTNASVESSIWGVIIEIKQKR